MPAATALAHPNIAFIKYWGNRDAALRIPVNGSISMNLAELTTRTQVTFDEQLRADRLILNGCEAEPAALQRVSRFLDVVRQWAGLTLFADVSSENNFPTGAGIASSAAAFAALALAASGAAGLKLTEQELSRLARRGSGSACRSVPGGFVEWQPGSGDLDSFARQVAPPGHWPLVDLVAVLEQGHKPVGSSEGHALAPTSPLQAGRAAGVPERLAVCRKAILERDFDALAAVTELDSNLMHAVMMTSTPALFYWQPASLAIMRAVPGWRAAGLEVCPTLDAGPNVHLICSPASVTQVRSLLGEMDEIRQVLESGPGGPARLV